MQQKEKKRILHTLIWTAGTSVCLVFLFLFLIQWDYLRAQRVVLSGAGRLSETLVLEKAGLRPGVNIFSVNLSKARKRLLSHPWIAEAAVGIGFPPEIRIRIKEHEALAVFELDRKYLANEDGRIFKEWDPLETRMLPVVSGLRYSDVDIAGKPEGMIREGLQRAGAYLEEMTRKLLAEWKARRSSETEIAPESAVLSDSETLPFKAVMNVLQSGIAPDSILPNRLIQDIRVDREMGITLILAPENEAVGVGRIRLGYHNYPVKYLHLQQLFRHLNREEHHLKIDSIDLNNPDRIVVNPTHTDSLARDYKEDI